MATELYFDTARLGRMCTEARKAEQDFSKLASQLGSSLYWEKFLIEGYEALSASLRSRCTTLSCWSGLAGLQQGLAEFVSLPADGSVLLAGQSRTLITHAAECLFERCDHVLATDLEWPPYLAVLKLAALRRGKRLSVQPVRQRVLNADINCRELTDEIVAGYFHRGCDGIFLSDITHTGVQLPYVKALHRIHRIRPPRFTVIDGAQALAQKPVRLAGGDVDLYLAGTQKWFGAYHPLRLAFVSPRATWASALLQRLLARRHLSDPLTEFCHAVVTNNWRVFGETVNLTALMTAAGALHRWNGSRQAIGDCWQMRLGNRRRLLRAVEPFASSAIDESLAAGVALLKINGMADAAWPCRSSLREALGRENIVASEPVRGMVRLALPGVPLSVTKLSRLRRALGRVVEATFLTTCRHRDVTSQMKHREVQP